jgi:hypothetical protein
MGSKKVHFVAPSKGINVCTVRKLPFVRIAASPFMTVNLPNSKTLLDEDRRPKPYYWCLLCYFS